MKKFLPLLVLFFILGETQAQVVYSPNTYYIILPTSGCNGIWAVQYPQNCIPFTFLISPWGCATINHYNGDTLFFDLCSIPCEYLVINDSGIVCMNCWLQQPTGIKENTVNGENLIVFPNPFNNTFKVIIESNDISEIIIYDIASRKLLQQQFTNTVTLNTAQLAKGMYIYEVRNRNGVVKKGKVIKE